MTPKEKAQQLIDKFTTTIWESGNTVSKPIIKQCALIAVDEIILFIDWEIEISPIDTLRIESYWQQVKQEIEKL